MLGFKLLQRYKSRFHTTAEPVSNSYQSNSLYAAYNITKKNLKVVVIWYSKTGILALDWFCKWFVKK